MSYWNGRVRNERVMKEILAKKMQDIQCSSVIKTVIQNF